mmetsp:Transcript_8818/g.27535  ORF Transcript_8818/g.27535 Transcript_8818/m.27535 type:complete len:378 (+) Transcript_8818:162-1295(+)
MSKLAFDYSKWDNIEISDDEADCHPNIDKASWFRMKHRSRVEREDTEEAEKRAMKAENKADGDREKEILKIVDEIKAGGEAAEYEDEDALRGELADVRARIQERLDKMDFMEKNKKWNVDNLSHTAHDRTILTGKGSDPADLVGGMVSGKSSTTGPVGPTSERDAVESYSKFVDEHEGTLEDFLATRSIEDCREKLHQHGGVLLHEHAQSYILLSCLEDEMNGFHDKMKLASRNSQVLSHVTELAQSLRRHPRDVVLPFFKRIAEEQYKAGFDDAVAGFVSRIEKRAVEKRKEMDKEAEERGEGEYEELTKEERIGPGGLDPVAVFETLPKSMQEAFESKDVTQLQVALEAMKPEEAKLHMDRCEQSGLWVANAGGK